MDVRIVDLEPMDVASALAYGAEPENAALRMLWAWERKQERPGEPGRLFGFNNPSPSEGSPNYGYEVWREVNTNTRVEPPMTRKQFGGGTYAVTRVVGIAHITETWMELVQWAESCPYERGTHQWLEEHLHAGEDVPPDDVVLDLYLPIRR